MVTSFKSSDIANKIGVTTHTIRRWVLRYPDYFSDDAKAPFRNQSVYTENDLRILMSIAELTNQGYGVQMIARKLKEGYLYEGSLEDIETAQIEVKPIYKGKAVQTLEERLAEMTQKQEALRFAQEGRGFSGRTARQFVHWVE